MWKLISKPIIIIPVLLSILYLNTLNASFQFDDTLSIVKNKSIQIKTLSFEAINKVIKKSYSPSRPIANISFALNYYIGGLNTIGYHIFNIIIHIITAITIYYFLSSINKIREPGVRNLNSEIALPLFTTLLWATSPVQTQAVTYIVQRMTSMSTMFYMLSLLCYVNGRIRKNKSNWINILLFFLSLLFGLFALGSKEIAATIPIIILLFEIYFMIKFEWNWKMILYVLLSIILVYFIANILITRSISGNLIDVLKRITRPRIIEEEFSSWERLLTEFRVIMYYISLLLFPSSSRLRVMYDIPVSHSITDPITTLLSIIFILGSILFAIYYSKRLQIISFFIIWFFMNHIIESSFLTNIHLAFEHRLYLPSIGFFAIITSIINQIGTKVNKFKFWRWSIDRNLIMVYCFSLIIITQSIWTIERNEVWRDQIELWRDNVLKEKGSKKAHNILGSIYIEYGKNDLAIQEFNEAIRLNPLFAEPHYNLGAIYGKTGALDQAISEYKKAIELSPNYYEPHNNLGLIYSDRDKIEEAIKELQIAIKIDPKKIDAHLNIGTAYGKSGKIDLAIKEYQLAISIDPDNAQSHFNLGLAYEVQGKTDLAIKEYQESLRINPSLTKAEEKLRKEYNKY